MPLYDYQCEKCENVFEVERPLTATGSVRCPSCGSTKTAKVFSAAGIVFKGSGFYVTDSKGKTPAPAKTDAPKSDTTPVTESKPASDSTPSSSTTAKKD
jgi:putative FmdB family regulatory protein